MSQRLSGWLSGFLGLSVALALDLNEVRRLAQLPPVRLEASLSRDCEAHARYLALSDQGEHREDPQSPYASEAGKRCASGHYYVTPRPDAERARALNFWATAPFHLSQLIDPRLETVAWGEAHDRVGPVQSAFVLDVRQGLTGQEKYPVRFPAPDQRSPFTDAVEHEWPDYRPGCPGAQSPLGAPVALLLGPGGLIKGAAIKVNQRPVAACLLTAQTFEGAGANDTRIGRQILARQGGAMLLPLKPLAPGDQVKVAFFTNQGLQSWSFGVMEGETP